MGGGGLTGRDLELLARVGRRLDGTALADADIAIDLMRTRLHTLWKQAPLIGYILGADFNIDTDQEITVVAAGGYIITDVLAWNPSGSFDTVAGGVYAGPSKSGTVIVAATQTYASLTGVAKWKALTLEAVCGTDWFVESRLYLSLTTPQGAAAAANLVVFGRALP